MNTFCYSTNVQSYSWSYKFHCKKQEFCISSGKLSNRTFYVNTANKYMLLVNLIV